MARACRVYVVVLNTTPLHAFTVKHECQKYLDREWPKCPTNLRVLSLPDGGSWKSERGVQDITARMYGLEEKDR